VIRIALQDGASIAGLLITTEAMVAEKPKKETPMPAIVGDHSTQSLCAERGSPYSDAMHRMTVAI
jgi:hypothetical protein